MYIVAGHLTWGSVITVAWGRGGNGGTPSPGAIERPCFKLLRTIHYSSVRQATATGKGPTLGRDNIYGMCSKKMHLLRSLSNPDPDMVNIHLHTKFHHPRCNTSRDMNFGPLEFWSSDRQTDRQTDGQKAAHINPPCIGTGELNKFRK